MSSVVIIGDGDFPRQPFPRILVSQADHIICCDGAFAHWLKVSPKIFGEMRLPDAVVGDMDSISPSLLKRYSDLMVRIDEQEENDQTKAMRHVLERFPDATEIHIIGATGKREDHTIGNMSLLMEYARLFGKDGVSSVPTVDIISDRCTAFAVTDSCSLSVGEGRRVSLFSPDNSLNIKSEGLVWPTDGVVFDNWWKATLNRAAEDTITLTFNHKSLALVVLD